MAFKKFYVGSEGPYLYDDADPINDPGGDFSGENQSAFTTNGSVRAETFNFDYLNPVQISEPSDPVDGESVMYSSNGSSSDENAGDFILKVNVGGTVKKHWLFAF